MSYASGRSAIFHAFAAICCSVMLLASAPALAEEASEDEAKASERSDYLLHDVHLPDGTMQLQLGLGSQFYQGLQYSELAGEVVARWGVSERVNVALPLMASFVVDEGASHRGVVFGGLQGFGVASTGEVATTISLGGGYEYLSAPDVVWALVARATHERQWTLDGSGLALAVSANRAQAFGDRWIVGIGTSLYHFTRTHSPFQFGDDVSMITFGAAGGFRRPLVQYRLWNQFHLYASSRLKLAFGDALTTVHEHVGGFNWFF